MNGGDDSNNETKSLTNTQPHNDRMMWGMRMVVRIRRTRMRRRSRIMIAH